MRMTRAARFFVGLAPALFVCSAAQAQNGYFFSGFNSASDLFNEWVQRDSNNQAETPADNVFVGGYVTHDATLGAAVLRAYAGVDSQGYYIREGAEIGPRRATGVNGWYASKVRFQGDAPDGLLFQGYQAFFTADSDLTTCIHLEADHEIIRTNPPFLGSMVELRNTTHEADTGNPQEACGYDDDAPSKAMDFSQYDNEWVTLLIRSEILHAGPSSVLSRQTYYMIDPQGNLVGNDGAQDSSGNPILDQQETEHAPEIQLEVLRPNLNTWWTKPSGDYVIECALANIFGWPCMTPRTLATMTMEADWVLYDPDLSLSPLDIGGRGDDMNGGVVHPSDVIHYFPFNGSADDVVGGVGGTLHGNAQFRAGKLGQAVAFDGASDYVKLDSLLLDNRPEWTLTGYVWLDSNTPRHSIFGEYSSSANGHTKNYMTHQGTDSSLNGLVYDNFLPFGGGIAGSQYEPQGQWVPFAFVRDDDEILIYSHGQLIAQGPYEVYTGSGNLVAAFGARLSSGGGVYSGGNRYSMHGALDEIKVFKIALDPIQIQATVP